MASKTLVMNRDFRADQSVTTPWHFSDLPGPTKDNVEWTPDGLRLWCRNGKGAYAMLDMAQPYGYWRARMRISGPTDRETNKVCGLLWPEQPPPALDLPKIWPPEIDFNESPLRLETHQTLHYGTRDENFMHHTKYDVDLRQWHTIGVNVKPGLVEYFCDGAVKTSVNQDVPVNVGYLGAGWNLHLRTEMRTADVTAMDIAWVSIYK